MIVCDISRSGLYTTQQSCLREWVQALQAREILDPPIDF